MVSTMTPAESETHRAQSRSSRDRDALTGLGLRGELEHQGARTLEEAGRAGHSVALLLVDLDSFKHLNDSAGHHVGDQVLVEAAARLRRAFGPDDLLVRLGGDEFAVLTGPDRGAESPADLAACVLDVFETPFHVDELELSVQASVGIATFPEDGDTVTALSLAADQAMYDAKESGTTRWRSANIDASLAPGWSTRLLADLERASSYSQMVVHFQPQLQTRTGQVCGFDALVRWNHPEHGLLPARRFVPLAARAGLLRPITSTVIAQALDALPMLQRHAPGSHVSISLTRRHILGNGLVEQLVDALEVRDIPAKDLLLKISEPLTQSRSAPQPIFERLAERELGVTIRGYGRAWSSLTALWRNPAVREVKIAPDLARAVATDPDAHRLVRALTHAATDLGLRVVAEGVEDAATIPVLAELGCDTAQGFWASPPLTLAEVVPWCRDRAVAGSLPLR